MARKVFLPISHGMAVLDGLERESMVRNTIVLTTTAETTLIALDANNFLDLMSLRLANSDLANTAVVTIRDATGGAFGEPWVIGPGQTGGFHGDPAAALKQSALNNNWTAQLTGAVTSLYVTAYCCKRPG
jgi:hypothetical protein